MSNEMGMCQTRLINMEVQGALLLRIGNGRRNGRWKMGRIIHTDHAFDGYSTVYWNVDIVCTSMRPASRINADLVLVTCSTTCPPPTSE